MTGFVKLYATILHSSLWVESDPAVKVVWITLLAMADRKGEVKASLPGIAHAAVLSIDEAKRAMALFEAPDEHSRSPEHEGRRLEKIEGGWRLLNYTKYREMEGESTPRVREHRARKRGVDTPLHETKCNDVTADADANAEAKAKEDPPPSQECASAGTFETWWKAYPRKVKKTDARKAWKKLEKEGSLPAMAEMLSKLSEQVRCADWNEEAGKFIPYPASYLNSERWEDDVSTYRPANGNGSRTVQSHTRGTFHPPGTLKPVHVIKPDLSKKGAA